MRAFLTLGSSMLLLACTSRSEITPEPDGSQPTKDASNDVVMSQDSSSDASASKPGWESGSRLRARVVTGADGSKQFYGWYDSQKKENCSFKLAGDGKLRCVPDVPNPQAIFYQDTMCVQQVVVAVSKGCSAPTIAIETLVYGNCPEIRYRVRPAGGQINPGSLYAKVGSQCISQDVTQLSQIYNFYATSMDVDPAEFVEGTIKAE